MNGSPDFADPDVDGPIDEVDIATLDEVAELYSMVDPVPDDLIERIRFAVALEEIDFDLMQLVEETPLHAGVRGEDRGRIFTFAAPLVTLMIRVVGVTEDTVRMDGWLAPPAAHRIMVRVGADRLNRTADDEGRFVVERMPAGLAQLFIGIAERAPGPGNLFATPAVEL
jgi:hypothetical protein